MIATRPSCWKDNLDKTLFEKEKKQIPDSYFSFLFAPREWGGWRAIHSEIKITSHPKDPQFFALSVIGYRPDSLHFFFSIIILLITDLFFNLPFFWQSVKDISSDDVHHYGLTEHHLCFYKTSFYSLYIVPQSNISRLPLKLTTKDLETNVSWKMSCLFFSSLEEKIFA